MTAAVVPWAAARFAFDGVLAATADRAQRERAEHPGRWVVAVDGSPASVRALQWVARAAPRRGGSIAVLDVVTSSEWVYDPDGFDPDRDARADTERIVRDVFGTSPPTSLRIEVDDGDPVERLLERSRHAEVVVVGSRLRSDGVEPPDSVGLRVAALAACPVVVIH